MTKEKILAQIAGYEKQIEAMTAQVRQINANVNAAQGGIVDCKYWLAELEKEATDGKAGE